MAGAADSLCCLQSIPQQPRIPPAHRFRHARKIILARPPFSSETADSSTGPACRSRKLTIDATANVPLMFEISKPSIRSGRGQIQHFGQFGQVAMRFDCDWQRIGHDA